MILYHGTNMVIEHPEVRIGGFNKDFGFGFYCTKMERQARRWAISKKILILFVCTSIRQILRSK